MSENSIATYVEQTSPLYRNYSDELQLRQYQETCNYDQKGHHFLCQQNALMDTSCDQKLLKELLKQNRHFRKKFDEQYFLSGSLSNKHRPKHSILSKLFHLIQKRRKSASFDQQHTSLDETCGSCDSSSIKTNDNCAESPIYSKKTEESLHLNCQYENMYRYCKQFIMEYERQTNFSEQSTQVNLTPNKQIEADSYLTFNENNENVNNKHRKNEHKLDDTAALQMKGKQLSKRHDKKKILKTKSLINLEKCVDGIDISFSKSCCLSLALMNSNGSMTYEKRNLSIPNRFCRVRLQIESAVWHCAARRIISNGPNSIMELYEGKLLTEFIKEDENEDDIKVLPSITLQSLNEDSVTTNILLTDTANNISGNIKYDKCVLERGFDKAKCPFLSINIGDHPSKAVDLN